MEGCWELTDSEIACTEKKHLLLFKNNNLLVLIDKASKGNNLLFSWSNLFVSPNWAILSCHRKRSVWGSVQKLKVRWLGLSRKKKWASTSKSIVILKCQDKNSVNGTCFSHWEKKEAKFKPPLAAWHPENMSGYNSIYRLQKTSSHNMSPEWPEVTSDITPSAKFNVILVIPTKIYFIKRHYVLSWFCCIGLGSFTDRYQEIIVSCDFKSNLPAISWSSKQTQTEIQTKQKHRKLSSSEYVVRTEKKRVEEIVEEIEKIVQKSCFLLLEDSPLSKATKLGSREETQILG